jgi:hypothetical protein
MKLLKSHITFCLFVLATLASAQTVKIGMSSKTAQHSQIISDLDGLFERALTEYNVPGMAVAIVKGRRGAACPKVMACA